MKMWSEGGGPGVESCNPDGKLRMKSHAASEHGEGKQDGHDTVKSPSIRRRS